MEKVRSELSSDAVLVGERRYVVDIEYAGVPERPDRVVLEELVGDYFAAPVTIGLGRHRRFFDGYLSGRVAVAAQADRIAVVAQVGQSSFGYAVIDVARRRILRADHLPLPTTSIHRPISWRHPSIASSGTGFGIAVADADRLAWVELDSEGRVSGPTRVTSGQFSGDVAVLWTGSRYEVLAWRTYRGRHYSTNVPEIWARGDDGFTTVASLGLSVDGAEINQWVMSGAPVQAHDAIFVAATTWPHLGEDLEQKFRLFRIGRDGKVSNRICERIDEE